MDAIALLSADHKLLRELGEKLADTTARAVETRKKLLKRLEIELKAPRGSHGVKVRAC